MNLIILLIVLIILFGGGGFYYGGPYVGGGFGLVLLIVRDCHIDDSAPQREPQCFASGGGGHGYPPRVDCMLPQEPMRRGCGQMAADVERVVDG